MSQPRCRGSVLVMCLVTMIVLTSLTGSMLALAAARCTALGRETRRAQALALAESAVAALCAQVDADHTADLAEGSLPTGRYVGTVERAEKGQLVLTASGYPLAITGRPVEVTIETTLVRHDGRWRVVAWQEVRP